MLQLEPLDGPDCWSDVEKFAHDEDRLETEGCICIEKGNGFVVDLVANTKEMWSNMKVSTVGPRVDAAISKTEVTFDFGLLEQPSNRVVAAEEDMTCEVDVINLVPDLTW